MVRINVRSAKLYFNSDLMASRRRLQTILAPMHRACHKASVLAYSSVDAIGQEDIAGTLRVCNGKRASSRHSVRSYGWAR
jgi:hypothetical protein